MMAGMEADQDTADGTGPVRGAGFWIRAAAHLLVDLPLLLLITIPLMLVLMIRAFGFEALLVPGGTTVPWWWHVAFNGAILVLLVGLWKFTQATPGKQIFGLRIVRLQDGGKPTMRQWTIRALGYLVASLPVIPVPVDVAGARDTLWVPCCLGFLWILVDGRNRGWHDLMSGTVTVRRAAS
jgi:uncharacterized RDD family membrane protein YckC